MGEVGMDKLKIKIHKGSHEIGGTCIELSHEGKSILLDQGMPLICSFEIISQ